MQKSGWLSIGRHPGESLYIDCPDGTRIVIYCKRIQRDPEGAQLGIQAPREYRIVRAELCEKIPLDTGGGVATADDRSSRTLTQTHTLGHTTGTGTAPTTRKGGQESHRHVHQHRHYHSH
jgi:sRNA-binding carbon storage regulator CsrA